jgi:MFS family permease
MIGLFTAASIQSAFVNISADLGVSMQRTSYLVSLFIAVLGGAPLFWRPLSNRFGRRPIFLISLICALVGNIGCAESHSYATMGLCRAITAFFISPAAAIGSAVVAEVFFKKDRARCMGYWTLMVTIGVPIAPFLFGFAVMRVGYRWIYWTLAIVSPHACLISHKIIADANSVSGQRYPVHCLPPLRLRIPLPPQRNGQKQRHKREGKHVQIPTH